MKKTFDKPFGMNENMHALLTAAVGCYLGYIAYKVIVEPGDMSAVLSMVLGVFFALAAVAVVTYAASIWLKARRSAGETAAEEASAITEESADAADKDDADD